MGYVSHKIPYEQHPCPFLSLNVSKSVYWQRPESARKRGQHAQSSSRAKRNGSAYGRLLKRSKRGRYQGFEKQGTALALTLLLCFLYDEFHWALSSAVRAFGLHPKGRPFNPDSAHHIFQSLPASLLSARKQIVRVLSVFSLSR